MGYNNQKSCVVPLPRKCTWCGGSGQMAVLYPPKGIRDITCPGCDGSGREPGFGRIPGMERCSDGDNDETGGSSPDQGEGTGEGS